MRILPVAGNRSDYLVLERLTENAQIQGEITGTETQPDVTPVASLIVN
jgi:hypothetical protein